MRLSALLTFLVLVTACSSKDDAVEYRDFTAPGQFTMRLPVDWQTAPGPQSSPSDPFTIGTFVLTANNGAQDPDDAAVMFIVRDDLTDHSLDDVVNAWSSNERVRWTSFDGFNPAEVDGQTTQRGEGSAQTLPGEAVDGIVAIYHREDRPEVAWILNCQAPAPIPADVKSMCETMAESFTIEAP